MNSGSPIRVLLVEDSPTDVLLAREAVETYPEFRLSHVERLAEALRVLVGDGFDIVLLDLGLPDSQGLDTLHRLLRAKPDVAVVVMTARDDEALALQAVQGGAQDYLVKSQVVNGILGRTIRYAIERRKAVQSQRERTALASLSADVGQAFTRGGTLREMLAQCAESMVRNLGVALARIWTLNPRENVLELQAEAGLHLESDGTHRRIPVGQAKIGLIAAERQPYLTNDVAHDPRISDPAWARREGLVAFAGYPLLLEDRLVGVVGLFARQRLSDTTLQALTAVANQIALGIERKTKDKALQESEQRFQELTEHIDQVLWMIDATEAKILYVSSGYEKLWGRSCQSLLDNPSSYLDGIHPLDLEMMRREDAAMYQTGHIDAECRILRPDGSVRWAWIRGYPVKKQDHIVRLVGVMEDITEKRRLAAERDALLSRLQLHIQRLPLAYILFDAEMRIVEWNPTAERVFGYAREEMLGKAPPYEDFVPRSFWEKGEALLQRIRAGHMEAHSLNENLTKDGRTITCQWFNTPLLEDDNRFVGFLCLAQDVTERIRLEVQYHQAQQRLQHVVASSPAVLFTLAVRAEQIQGINWISANLLEVFGHPPEAALHPDWWLENIHPEDRDRVFAQTHAELFSYGHTSHEYRFRYGDSGYRWTRGELRLIRDSFGQPVEVVGAWSDITERKRAERYVLAQHAVTRVLAEALSLQQASANLLQALCEGLEWELGALWRVDRAAQVLRCVLTWHRPSQPFANFALENTKRIFAADHSLPGRVWVSRQAAWIPDVVNDANFARTQLVLECGLRGAVAFPILSDNEILGVVEFFSRDGRSPDEELLQMMVAVGSQIGQFMERKQAEDALRQTNQRLQTLIQASPLAIVTLDLQGIIQSWNPAAERIFGWREEEVLGRPLPFIPPAKQKEYQTLFQQELEGKQALGFETQRLRKDGSSVEVRISTAPLHDAHGQHVGLLGLLADITEQKLLEEQFRQAQKMEAIGSLAGGVAHDFNNLLTIINGYSDIIQSQLAADHPMRELAQEIGRAGDRAASLTRQLLAFSRKQVLEPKVLNLNTIVTDMVKMLQRLIGEDVDLQTVLEPRLGSVKADAGQLEQVLVNLAVNARDAMPQGGKLTIETANTELHETYTHAYPGLRPGHYVLLAVTDTGTGMEEATKARIFEPFFTTKEPGKGTGLGLATVFGIAKQSEGHIAVYSELGHGTTFKVYLPRVAASSGSGIFVPSHNVAAQGTETLLMVEDEPALRALTRHILGTRGYTILEAGDGASALRLAEEYVGTIHLLVTDVVMPGMSGRQLAERLTAVRPGLKVLYLSGYTDDAVLRHGVLQAETAFLQKPFTPNALAKKVREVLDR